MDELREHLRRKRKRVSGLAQRLHPSASRRMFGMLRHFRSHEKARVKTVRHGASPQADRPPHSAGGELCPVGAVEGPARCASRHRLVAAAPSAPGARAPKAPWDSTTESRPKNVRDVVVAVAFLDDAAVKGLAAQRKQLRPRRFHCHRPHRRMGAPGPPCLPARCAQSGARRERTCEAVRSGAAGRRPSGMSAIANRTPPV